MVSGDAGVWHTLRLADHATARYTLAQAMTQMGEKDARFVTHALEGRLTTTLCT
jgi:hypothetical protein